MLPVVRIHSKSPRRLYPERVADNSWHQQMAFCSDFPASAYLLSALSCRSLFGVYFVSLNSLLCPGHGSRSPAAPRTWKGSWRLKSIAVPFGIHAAVWRGQALPCVRNWWGVVQLTWRHQEDAREDAEWAMDSACGLYGNALSGAVQWQSEHGNVLVCL